MGKTLVATLVDSGKSGSFSRSLAHSPKTNNRGGVAHPMHHALNSPFICNYLHLQREETRGAKSNFAANLARRRSLRWMRHNLASLLTHSIRVHRWRNSIFTYSFATPLECKLFLFWYATDTRAQRHSFKMSNWKDNIWKFTLLLRKFTIFPSPWSV
jgi:hypothetical protein